MGEAVSRLLAYNEWFRAQVRIGLNQIQRREFIEEAEMMHGFNTCCALEAYSLVPGALPYIVVYSVGPEVVNILRIVHTSPDSQ